MSVVVAIGDERRLGGYTLAGVDVVGATTAAEIDAAWEQLAPDTALLLLTPDAQARLADRLVGDHLLWAVLP